MGCYFRRSFFRCPIWFAAPEGGCKPNRGKRRSRSVMLAFHLRSTGASPAGAGKTQAEQIQHENSGVEFGNRTAVAPIGQALVSIVVDVLGQKMDRAVAV